MQGEKVLVVKRTDLFGDRDQYAFQGMLGRGKISLESRLVAPFAEYRDRAEMEENPEFKQIIPYCLFLYQGQLFYYTRGKGQGEHRLHDKVSVGVGGHLNPIDDAEAKDPNFLKGMMREITEEVDIYGSYKHQILGYLNDDSNEVGRVHLGVVNLFELSTNLMFSKEGDMEPSGFVPIMDLKAGGKLEPWSGIVVDYCLMKGWHHPGCKVAIPEVPLTYQTSGIVGSISTGGNGPLMPNPYPIGAGGGGSSSSSNGTAGSSGSARVRQNLGWIDIDPQVIVDLFKYKDTGVHFKVVEEMIPAGAAFESITILPHGNLRIRFTGAEPKQYNPQIQMSKFDTPVKAAAVPCTDTRPYCTNCDGCGWYEGGPTLQTTCEVCKGTGRIG